VRSLADLAREPLVGGGERVHRTGVQAIERVWAPSIAIPLGLLRNRVVPRHAKARCWDRCTWGAWSQRGGPVQRRRELE
jgi:hypothetical protein